MRLPPTAKRVIAPAAAAGFGLLRVSRFPRVARQRVTYLDLLPYQLRWATRNRRYWTDYRRSFVWDEEVPGAVLPAPDRPLHRPIRSTCLVLDTRDPGFSFRNNYVLDPERRIVYEEIAWTQMSVRFQLLEAPKRVAGTAVYLSNTDIGNYYHWMCLTLPLLSIYRTRLGIEPDFCYIGNPQRPFQIETLARAGIAAERILTEAVSADRLVAALVNRDQAVNRAMLQFTRDLFPPSRAAPTRRLFVARGAASGRILVNEDECYAFLREHYGFERVVMDGLPVAEQARLFSEAEAIVAPHGAALTNLLFARPSARVLELVSADYAVPCFLEIAACVGCAYDRVFGRNVPDRAGHRLNKADFAIERGAFEAAARRLFDEVSQRPRRAAAEGR
jgi:Glycosyltransferase 61